MQAADQTEQIRKLKAHVKVLSQVVIVLLELLPDKHPGKKLERSLFAGGFLPQRARSTSHTQTRSSRRAV